MKKERGIEKLEHDLTYTQGWLEKRKNKLKKFFRFIRIVKNWPSHYWWKLSKPEYVIYKMRNSALIRIRAGSHDRIALNEVWIHEIYSPKELPINTTDTIIDIGAHVGTFTLKAALQSTSGTIYSYELAPDSYKLLVKNIELNKLTNVIASNIAVSTTIGEASVYLHSDNSLANSLINNSSKTGQQIRIKTTTLDEIITQHKLDRIDLIKIDCEGSEYDILFNASSTALSIINRICVEADNIDQTRNPKTMTRFLNDNNFLTRSVRTPYGGIVIYAYRNDKN